MYRLCLFVIKKKKKTGCLWSGHVARLESSGICWNFWNLSSRHTKKKLSHNLHYCRLSVCNETTLWTASCSLHHDSFTSQVPSSIKHIKSDMISSATHSRLKKKNMTTSRGEKLGGIRFWQIGQFETGSLFPVPHVLSYRFVQIRSDRF